MHVTMNMFENGHDPTSLPSAFDHFLIKTSVIIDIAACSKRRFHFRDLFCFLVSPYIEQIKSDEKG